MYHKPNHEPNHEQNQDSWTMPWAKPWTINQGLTLSTTRSSYYFIFSLTFRCRVQALVVQTLEGQRELWGTPHQKPCWQPRRGRRRKTGWMMTSLRITWTSSAWSSLCVLLWWGEAPILNNVLNTYHQYLFRIKWCGWVAVYCSCISFANTKYNDDTKQIMSSFMLSISAVVMSYLQNPTPMTLPFAG